MPFTKIKVSRSRLNGHRKIILPEQLLDLAEKRGAPSPRRTGASRPRSA